MLPDNWKFNEEYTVKIPPCTHLSKYENASKYTNYEFYTDDYTRCASYDLNVFTSAEWAEVEAKGAVFFPNAEVDWPVCTPSGSRAKKKYRTMKKSETLEGSYWTSTSSDESVRCLEFNETEISIPVRFRECRRPVRLAQDCNKIKH